MTTTLFIERFLSGLPNYITCLPSDLIFNINNGLLLKTQSPSFFVVNSSPSHIHKVGHWMLVIIHSKHEVELFDSLALCKDQLPAKIVQFVSKFKKVKFSSKSIQSPLSNFCGVFTIARAHSVCKGESLSKFYSYFHTELLHQNDIRATKYIIDSISNLY